MATESIVSYLEELDKTIRRIQKDVDELRELSTQQEKALEDLERQQHDREKALAKLSKETKVLDNKSRTFGTQAEGAAMILDAANRQSEGSEPVQPRKTQKRKFSSVDGE